MDGANKFVIIDGNAILHRAYHALPALTNPKGEPTGAVYGFFSMLLRIIQEINPDFLAVTFDRPKPTFRQSMYVGYQANRPKMADDLGIQITSIHKLLEELKIKIFEVDGFEADDVIGTLAAKFVKDENSHERDVIIVTGDRDLLQLVNRKVKILMPVVGISKMYLYDAEKVREKFGITPSQIVSYKALIGDSSDNYPGVPGVGPKTAMDLINKFGEVDQIYHKLGDIASENPKLADKLVNGQESAILCKTLATIVQDVPFSLNFEECKFPQSSYEEFDEVFKEFGFKTLRVRLAEVFNKPNPIEPDKKPQKKKTNQLQLLD